jgi:hypothetical protein
VGLGAADGDQRLNPLRLERSHGGSGGEADAGKHGARQADAGMVAAKLGASEGEATTPVPRISCEPSAQTTAWAL